MAGNSRAAAITFVFLFHFVSIYFFFFIWMGFGTLFLPQYIFTASILGFRVFAFYSCWSHLHRHIQNKSQNQKHISYAHRTSILTRKGYLIGILFIDSVLYLCDYCYSFRYFFLSLFLLLSLYVYWILCTFCYYIQNC